MSVPYPEESKSDVWLGLNEAARYLGVHFTTLRRWSDTGKIPCVRTPGGRRRYALAELQRFVEQIRLPAIVATQEATDRQIRPGSSRKAHWMGHLGDADRSRFKASGQKLLGLLMQYNSRVDSGDIFLAEATRQARDYGLLCFQAGMTISETVEAFLFFRHSITEMIFDTSVLTGPNDADGKRLFQRTNDFMDTLLLMTVESYGDAQVRSITNPA